jgi:superfamily II DNA or RNA helicase
MITLRGYQERGIELVRDAMRKGHKRILVVAPTGTGKGTMAAYIACLVNQAHNRSAFLVHRREIALDIAARAFTMGLEPTLVLPEHRNTPNDAAFYCGTIQSFIARQRRGLEVEDLRVVQFDEAHHFRPKKGMYHTLAEKYPNAFFIGHTATPIRMDGRGLGDFFDVIITLLTYQEAIDQGYLVQPRYFTPFTPDMSDAPTVGGDYDEAYTEKLMNTSQLVGDIVTHYSRYAKDRQAIVYATTRAHGRSLAREFTAAGFFAEYVDGETEDSVRSGVIERVKAGETQILVNVGVYTEGTDIPCISAIVMAKPSKSYIYHLQTIGRGLRTFAGKSDCMVLDHAGNVERLGFVEDFGAWEIKKSTHAPKNPERKLRDPPILHTCENCGQEFYSSPHCPVCGWKLPRSKREEDFAPEDGELTELTRTERKAATIHTPAVKDEWLGMLKYIRNLKGYKDGWAAWAFKDKFGHFPARVHAITPQVPSEEVLAFIESKRKKSIRRLKAIESSVGAREATFKE